MRARTRTVVRRTPQRRKLVWARYATSITITTPAIFSDNILSRFTTDLGGGLAGITVMRTRGTINWQCNSLLTPGVQHFLVAGLQVVDAAGTTGPAPEPTDPENREHTDWYYHRWETWFFNGLATGQAAPNQTSFTMREWPLDVRSKRKIDEVEQLPAVHVKIPTATVANNVTVSIALATLLALP